MKLKNGAVHILFCGFSFSTMSQGRIEIAFFPSNERSDQSLNRKMAKETPDERREKFKTCDRRLFINVGFVQRVSSR
ncbi:hypothetical protein OUZ56_003844 [Daphnia magna]|uniref:Secreted protein n=1 Tax=Daphnia magna TaxID=35525 RepID=A0ABQ9YMY7_9CRUS|nr:hypothetical protein OUZ56_003844 [Daphnia magna]